MRAIAKHCALPLIGLLLACTEGGPETPTGTEGAIDRVREVLAIDDDIERVRRLAVLLQSLPPEAAPEVAQAFENSFVERGDIELVLFVQWWVPHDVEGANDWANTSWRLEHPRVEYAVMRAIGRLDPERALRVYYEQKRGPRTYATALQAVIVGWYESRKPGLLEFIDTQPSVELRQQTLGTFARLKVLDEGAEKATAWAQETAQRRENDRFSELLLQRIANASAEVEPEITAAWAKQMIEAGGSTKLLPRVANRWSKRDPLAALEWLSGFEETSDQRFAVRRSFTNYHLGNLLAAEPWLMGQGEATFTWLAPALEYLLKTKTDRFYAKPHSRAMIDWKGNLGLALQIREEESRWGTIGHIARLWVREDPAAADAWMEEHGVPRLYREKAHGPLPAGYQQQLLDFGQL